MRENNDTSVPNIIPVSQEPKFKGSSKSTEKRNKAYEKQRIMYNALQDTSNPLKLKEIIGAKTVADVYRTLDKLTIRREFHDALTRAGITFEFLIEGIKREAIGGDKSMDRLKAYEMLLKTLGLDRYDDVSTGSTSSWEERLLKAIDEHEGILDQDISREVEKVDYSVTIPQIPSSVQEKKKVSDEMEDSLTSHDYPRPTNLTK